MNRSGHKDSGVADVKESTERLTPEKFQRLIAEAKERGEPTTPILRRFALDMIDATMERHRKRQDEE